MSIEFKIKPKEENDPEEILRLSERPAMDLGDGTVIQYIKGVFKLIGHVNGVVENRIYLTEDQISKFALFLDEHGEERET